MFLAKILCFKPACGRNLPDSDRADVAGGPVAEQRALYNSNELCAKQAEDVTQQVEGLQRLHARELVHRLGKKYICRAAATLALASGVCTAIKHRKSTLHAESQRQTFTIAVLNDQRVQPLLDHLKQVHEAMPISREAMCGV